jgi:hypothetical protein
MSVGVNVTQSHIVRKCAARLVTQIIIITKMYTYILQSSVVKVSRSTPASSQRGGHRQILILTGRRNLGSKNLTQNPPHSVVIARVRCLLQREILGQGRRQHRRGGRQLKRRLLLDNERRKNHTLKQKCMARQKVKQEGILALTKQLTETMCPMADNTPIAPNNAPTSEPRPQACKHTPPRDCKAGLPPEVNEDKQERATKAPCDLLLVMATRLSAIPSTARDIEAR